MRKRGKVTCSCGLCKQKNVETEYSPVKKIVKTTTNNRTIRRVHPTHIENIEKNIIRVENYYPITESNVSETIVEEYNCGSDLNNPCCELIKRYKK
ncbi:hypothetical protein J7E71_07015 [Mesobacillus foraminis]|uniref:CotD family spore coat protein n=1 Tax=Mesobacillus foraminis TaxID=279826 RepID=UPI001BEC0920|nr:CotD family spore coat protein [Mesobacillus foraminis]MBT2755709.1 hypothetical protein [Mesobacillus foraminis]